MAAAGGEGMQGAGTPLHQAHKGVEEGGREGGREKKREREGERERRREKERERTVEYLLLSFKKYCNAFHCWLYVVEEYSGVEWSGGPSQYCVLLGAQLGPECVMESNL